MQYTPGWGMLITAASTLAGVALTQWNTGRQSATKRAASNRAEHREIVLEVLEQTALLVTKMDRFSAKLDEARDSAAAGNPVNPDHFFTKVYKEVVAQSSELTRAMRKADLVATEKKIIYALQKLRTSAKTAAQARSAAGRAAEAGQPDSAELRSATAHLVNSGLRLSNITRRQFAFGRRRTWRPF